MKSVYLPIFFLMYLATLPVMAQRSDTIPFELTSHNNLSIEATLNGSDTLQLMLHTAANSVTVLSSSADRLSSIDWTNETEVNSWGGSSKARFSNSNKLSIGQITWDSLAIWETQQSGPGTEGKFGPNLFAGKVVVIDFDLKSIIIREGLPVDMEGFQKLPLLLQDGNMFIKGTSTIGERAYPHLFLLHSGYGSTILYDDEFVEKSKIGTQIKIIGEKTLKDSYGNIVITKKGQVPLFSIGETSFTNLPAGFFDGAIGRQKMSVLGGDILRRFNIILGADRNFIYLKPNKQKDAAFTQF